MLGCAITIVVAFGAIIAVVQCVQKKNFTPKTSKMTKLS